jgi:hypothetical protein
MARAPVKLLILIAVALGVQFPGAAVAGGSGDVHRGGNVTARRSAGGARDRSSFAAPALAIDEIKAVSFTAWSEYAFASEDALQSLINARNIGCNWIAICVWEFQEDISATEIAPDYALYSARRESVVQAIAWCHQLGLNVMLKPMVDMSNDPGHWRGQIVPSTEWFAAYEDFVNSWAIIAQDNNVELFCVGCEFVNTVSWSASWRSVIQGVRNRYGGPLVYAANHGNEQSVTWWDALDFIGIDAYYPLTSKNDPSPAELQAAWNTRANSIEAWRAATWPAKQVMFTEVGYQSLDGTNRTPWRRDPATNDLDPAEQADCYEALLSACEGRSWWLGAFWWNWETDPDAGGLLNWDFTPRNKPAELVLCNHYTPPLTITNIRETGAGDIELIWLSSGLPGTTYAVWYSDEAYSTAMSWSVLASGVATGGCTTTWADATPPASGQRFYKVAEEGGGFR